MRCFKTAEKLGRACDYHGSFPDCRKHIMVNISLKESSDVMNSSYQLENIHLEAMK